MREENECCRKDKVTEVEDFQGSNADLNATFSRADLDLLQTKIPNPINTTSQNIQRG